MRDADWEKDPDGASVRSTLVAGGRKIAAGNAIDVEVIDFPAFLKKLIAKHKKIAFLKMDIEGSEYDVLENIVKSNLFIGQILIEFHDRFLKMVKKEH